MLSYQFAKSCTIELVKKFVAIILGLSLHFSVCTGGAFSIVTTYANSLSEDNVIMSPAFGDFFLCTTFTPAGNTDLETSDASGCTQKDSCLTKTTSRQREQLLELSFKANDLLYQSSEIIVAKEVPLASMLQVDSLPSPLFADARLLAHTLYKRE